MNKRSSVKSKLFGVIAFTMLIGFAMLGCDNPTRGNQGTGQLRSIGIVGARALMVAPMDSVVGIADRGRAGIRPLGGNENVLLKQLDDGSWIQVRKADEDSNELQMRPPRQIRDLTDRWMAMDFGTPVRRRSYLVCKLTGYVYDISEIGFPDNAQTDGKGNLYWQTSHRIVKVSLGSTYGIATAITPDTLAVDFFVVDSHGNVLYLVGGFVSYWLIRTAEGITFRPAPDFFLDDEGYPLRIIASLGGMYVHRTDGLYRMEITGNNSYNYDIIFIPVDIENPSDLPIPVGFRLYSHDRIIIINREAIMTLHRGGKPTITGIHHGLPDASFPVVGQGASSEYVFWAVWDNDFGLDMLYALNIETGAVKNIALPPRGGVLTRNLVGIFDNAVLIDDFTFTGNRAIFQVFLDGSKEILREDIHQEETIILVRVR